MIKNFWSETNSKVNNYLSIQNEKPKTISIQIKSETIEFDLNSNQLRSHKSKTCLDYSTLNQQELNVTQNLNNKTITCNNLNKSKRKTPESEFSHNSIGKEKARSIECNQCQKKFSTSSNLLWCRKVSNKYTKKNQHDLQHLFDVSFKFSDD